MVPPPSADDVQPNGSSQTALSNGALPISHIPHIKLASDATHSQVLRSFRCLIADLCQQFNGGHPGGAMGMAAIGTALWRYTMLYSPKNPAYINRDRFVLSNGHTCLFQYTFMHLAGYEHMTMDQLQTYHSTRVDSFCPGHPEIEHPGIEVTTGPLGQGIANAVGLAMATKHLGATYNRPGFDMVNNMTYCMTGDACLQEGVALEAISLAGHWKLNNLVLIYDNNQITCDGSVDLTNTEDVNAKIRACNWDVIDVFDGCYDVPALVAALRKAKESTEKPTFINVRTVIGVGSTVQGEAVAHGAAFGANEVRRIKIGMDFSPEQHFIIPDEVYAFFADLPVCGMLIEDEWNSKLESYATAYPDLAAEFKSRMSGKPSTVDWSALLSAPSELPTTPIATRKAAGQLLTPLFTHPNFLIGTADVTPSVHLSLPSHLPTSHPFNSPTLLPTSGPMGSYAGRYIHYGIREHSMLALSSGLAAFSPHCILPVTSTFLQFHIYAAPALRMAALMRLQGLHIGTHDSIGTGEDGPTHQPIALPAFLRALPNTMYIRPADAEETAGAIVVALQHTTGPTVLSLSRHTLPPLVGALRDGVTRGGYVLFEDASAVVTLVSAGSELQFAVAARDALKEKYAISARVVSLPCMALFAQQIPSYRRGVLRRGEMPAVAVEAYAMTGWERWTDAGYGMSGFGKSLPGEEAYRWFGFEGGKVADAVKGWLEALGEGEGERTERRWMSGLREIGWCELNESGRHE